MSTRRRFLKTAATSSALLGLGDLSGLEHLNVLNATETDSKRWNVQYSADVEPIVRLIEETPLDKCIAVMVEQLRRGLSYRGFMTALFLAGLRNGSDLGYYHCVYMIHSANQLSLDAPLGERLLAMFGALFVFKDWQNIRAKDPAKFGMQRYPEVLPEANEALPQFRASMEAGDPDAAERAIIALARSEGANSLFDLISQYGFLAHGVHSWIFVANAWRCLDAMGWEHAEPVLRALARNMAGKDDWYAKNREEARIEFGPLPQGWTQANSDRGMTLELMDIMRQGRAGEAFRVALRELSRGKIRAGAIWDAVHLAAGEAYVRGDAFNALHSITGLNALHYAFRTCGATETRLLILMRAVTWMCQNTSAYPTNAANPLKITDITPVDIPASPELAAEEIQWSAPTLDGAIGKAMAFALEHPDPQALWQARRRLVFMKGDDAHDYKFLAAVWENSQQISLPWRPHLLAASVGRTRDVGQPDSAVLIQAREALRRL